MNAISTRRYTTTTEEPGSGAAGAPAVDPLAESIIYVCALIADQPRAIDRYIDYFGERRPIARRASRSASIRDDSRRTGPRLTRCLSRGISTLSTHGNG